jgi:hypothetical protein
VVFSGAAWGELVHRLGVVRPTWVRQHAVSRRRVLPRRSINLSGRAGTGRSSAARRVPAARGCDEGMGCDQAVRVIARRRWKPIKPIPASHNATVPGSGTAAVKT